MGHAMIHELATYFLGGNGHDTKLGSRALSG